MVNVFVTVYRCLFFLNYTFTEGSVSVITYPFGSMQRPMLNWLLENFKAHKVYKEFPGRTVSKLTDSADEPSL